ncbi:MAG: FtsX-like permease family protein [Clostridia bacterium]|nr:FtsX-like permease family protein [Clostridia bacterium]
MFSKLALKNVRRSFQDYSVYFLTLVFGVCVFYVFNSLEGQWVIQTLARNRHYMIETIMTFMNVFSVFVSLVLACLVLYANRFLMKRRKRELGTYFLLGLPTGKVSLLLALEQVLIGLAALAVGLLLGFLASQGLGLLTVSMFSASMAEFAVVFSLPAAGRTVLFFGVIFLVVILFTGVSVSRAKLLDLMQSQRQNEELRERPLWVSVLLFLTGAALLGTAYAMVLIRGILYIDALFFLMLALGTAGTLLFFRSLSGFLLRIVKGRKKVYYKGLNMFVLRQFNSRIHTTYLSMTVVCLLLLLAIGITACSVGLNNTVEGITTGQAPYDLTVMNYGYTGARDDPDPIALLESGGLDTEGVFSDRCVFPLYYNESAVTGVPDGDAYAAVRRSDYDRLRAMQGMSASTQPDAVFPADILLMDSGDNRNSAVVIPDGMAAALSVRRQVANFSYAGDKEAAEAAFRSAESALDQSSGSFISFSRLDSYYDNMGSKILVLFMGLYLGLMFLITAAAVLALQQLSQAADNIQRYRILDRLGVPKDMRDRSILTQVFLAFFLPLSLAAVHAVVGMTAANAVIAEVGKLDVGTSSLTAALFILLIYGAYFAATYFGSRRVARGDS